MYVYLYTHIYIYIYSYIYEWKYKLCMQDVPVASCSIGYSMWYNTMMKRLRKTKRAYFSLHFQITVHHWGESGQELEAEITEEGCLLAHWQGRSQLAQDHLPRNGADHNRLGPPPSVKNQVKAAWSIKIVCRGTECTPLEYVLISEGYYFQFQFGFWSQSPISNQLIPLLYKLVDLCKYASHLFQFCHYKNK